MTCQPASLMLAVPDPEGGFTSRTWRTCTCVGEQLVAPLGSPFASTIASAAGLDTLRGPVRSATGIVRLERP